MNVASRQPTAERLRELLQADLSFADNGRSPGVHTLHAYAARFPPRLPRWFIEGLSVPGQVVLDPMAGSGVTTTEAWLLGRAAISVDVDPLAVGLCAVKTTRLAGDRISMAADRLLSQAWLSVRMADPIAAFRRELDTASQDFVDYWFTPEVQAELAALALAIAQEPSADLRRLFQIILSSLIITKSGGVSLARDLAHSRPHKVTDKRPASPLKKFEAALIKAIQAFEEVRDLAVGPSLVVRDDSRALGLRDQSVDLIVTSPPYANALDYMRAHKFSLVWLGKGVRQLGALRGEYIGSERRDRAPHRALPTPVEDIIADLAALDVSKAMILEKYFRDMKLAFEEMYRVLRQGSAAVIVVGPSTMRGVRIETQHALAALAAHIGFQVVDVVGRPLPRDRRMMPMRADRSGNSIIEQRMHEEFVIGLVRP